MLGIWISVSHVSTQVFSKVEAKNYWLPRIFDVGLPKKYFEAHLGWYNVQQSLTGTIENEENRAKKMTGGFNFIHSVLNSPSTSQFVETIYVFE